MLKGLTVWYLLHKTFQVEPHHRVLIHAAAGGIGLLACQWARAMGAHVIGTVGSKEKADLALANGCDHVILYNEEDFVARVKQISRNELCDVVYDGVGKTTFPGSLSCLKPRGLFVSFGNASGPVPPFAISELNNHGSLFATRPKLNDYVSTRKELLEGADTLFAAVINGKLHVPINHAYALKDAAKAHIDLEGRATTGAAICGRNSSRHCEEPTGRLGGPDENSATKQSMPPRAATWIASHHRARELAAIRRLSHAPRGSRLHQNRVETIDHQRNLLSRDVERRHEAQRVRLRRVEQHAVRKRLRHDRGADRQFQIEREQQAAAADFAEAMPRRQPLQFALQEQAGIGGRFQEVRLADLFEHGKAGRAHQRIAVEGAALVAMLEAGGVVRSRARRPAARRRRCPCRAS